jgi:hypothetical protein
MPDLEVELAGPLLRFQCRTATVLQTATPMALHLQVLADNWDASFGEYAEMLQITRIDYYGTAPQSALDFDKGAKYPVGLKPRHVAGVTRASAG